MTWRATSARPDHQQREKYTWYAMNCCRCTSEATLLCAMRIPFLAEEPPVAGATPVIPAGLLLSPFCPSSPPLPPPPLAPTPAHPASPAPIGASENTGLFPVAGAPCRLMLGLARLHQCVHPVDRRRGVPSRLRGCGRVTRRGMDVPPCLVCRLEEKAVPGMRVPFNGKKTPTARTRCPSTAS
jgi:hypothetical protein